jgi:predicted RNA-binding Zn ribbon-like protein
MMAGETVQPGGRAPAPGALAVVQAFINTHYDLEVDHGAELLSSPESLAAWLLARGLATGRVPPRVSELAHALAAREALRAVARVNGAGPMAGEQALAELDRAARGAPVEVAFGPQGPDFVTADGGVAGAIGVLMAITARSMIDGTWSRLKVCPGHECGWAFYDHSRNQAGRWCSMSVCGGRAKARAHYRRRRSGAG